MAVVKYADILPHCPPRGPNDLVREWTGEIMGATTPDACGDDNGIRAVFCKISGPKRHPFSRAASTGNHAHADYLFLHIGKRAPF